MEFKRKRVRMRRARRARACKAKGLKRVTVRGRKRWVRPKASPPNADGGIQ